MSRRLRTVAARVRWEVRSIVGQYPRLAMPLLRRRHGEREFLRPVRGDTEIAIDGFPRSGNTFALHAFRLAQGREVPVAHHVHLPAQLMEAARLGVPAMALIRRPEDAVTSLLVRLPELGVGGVLRSYLRFYRPLRPYLDRVIVADFEDLVEDFGAVVRRVNQRFGTEFREFEHTEENVGRVFEVIEQGDRRRFGSGEALDRGIARPSASRDRMKDEIRAAYGRPEHERLRRAAQEAYRSLTG